MKPNCGIKILFVRNIPNGVSIGMLLDKDPCPLTVIFRKKWGEASEKFLTTTTAEHLSPGWDAIPREAYQKVAAIALSRRKNQERDATQASLPLFS